MSSIQNKQYNFTMDYSPHDFFYSTHRNQLPNDNMCKVLEEDFKLNAIDCDDNQNLEKCYKHELCKNNKLVNEMYNQRNQHVTSSEGYDDLQRKRKFAILKTINLTAGIVSTLVFIYYYNK